MIKQGIMRGKAVAGIFLAGIGQAGAQVSSSVAGGVAGTVSTGGGNGVPAFSLPHDLSPLGMFMAADPVVKAVMLGLLAASALTWVILLAKAFELAAARRSARHVVDTVLRAPNLAEAVQAMKDKNDSAAQLVQATAVEMRLSMTALDGAGREGLKERVASVLSRIEQRAGRHMSRGTSILATIGSIAPFVGLFGTVWGIMNAFIGISETQTTNLAVVAPGIAEALLATAIGLVAAIPAVVIYNVFARSVTAYRHILADAAAGVERLVSRDLDFRAAGKQAEAGAVAPAAE